MTTPAGPGCPRWCTNTHRADWTIHVLNCGEVALGEVTYSVDVVKYRDDEPEMISICVYTPDEARVSNHTPEQARHVYDALGTALTLLDGDRGTGDRGVDPVADCP